MIQYYQKRGGKNEKFKMPTKSNLKGRTSTINNAFTISITPYIRPTEEEFYQMYKKLKLEPSKCAYCLNEATTTDHLKPLVKNGLPTGYITNIKNLVPCCSSCNSSKGSKNFSDWYLQEKNKNRLYAMEFTDKQIEERYNIICKYEKELDKPLDYEKILGKKLYNEYKERIEVMNKLLKKNQEFCDTLKEKIEKNLNKFK